MSPKSKKEYIKPEDVPEEKAKRVLDFLNQAKNPEEIAKAIEFPGERDVDIGVAKRIFEARKKIGKFKNLKQVDDVKQVGPERFTEIVRALGEKKGIEHRHRLPRI